jgi:hypothetical protein
VQLPGYLTPGLLDFESGNSPIHSSFSARSNLFLFFTFFQFVPNSLFKKEKLAKSILLSAFDAHENFFLNCCGIKYYAIFSGHIGDGYREIQKTGAHRWDLQTFAGVPSMGKEYMFEEDGIVKMTYPSGAGALYNFYSFS